MPQDGWRSYLILWEQIDWSTTSGAVVKQIIYDFMTTTLRSASDPITPTRIHRNPSPVKQIPNMVNAGGDIVLHHHPEHMLLFWKHLLMDAPSSVDFTKQTVRTNGIYTSPLSLTTQPGSTTPPSDPGKLIVTFSVAKTGTVTISGTDQNGTAISEVLTFTAETTKTTTKYFQTVNANGVVLTMSGDNLLIECDKNTYTHTFNLGDNVYVDEAADKHGLAIELVKSTIPNLYEGCLLNTGVLTLADTMQLTLGILARYGNLREAFNGTGTPTDISGYSNMADTDYPYGDEIYPGWGASIQLDIVQTDIESMTFSFSNNLGYPTRYRASRLPVKPIRQGDREISLSCTVDYETVADGGVNFDDKFYGDVPIAVILSMVSKPYAGAEYTFSLTMPRCQLTAFPDAEVGGPADMLQTLSLRPIRTVGASSSDEISSLVITSTEAA